MSAVPEDRYDVILEGDMVDLIRSYERRSGRKVFPLLPLFSFEGSRNKRKLRIVFHKLTGYVYNETCMPLEDGEVLNTFSKAQCDDIPTVMVRAITWLGSHYSIQMLNGASVLWGPHLHTHSVDVRGNDYCVEKHAPRPSDGIPGEFDQEVHPYPKDYTVVDVRTKQSREVHPCSPISCACDLPVVEDISNQPFPDVTSDDLMLEAAMLWNRRETPKPVADPVVSAGKDEDVAAFVSALNLGESVPREDFTVVSKVGVCDAPHPHVPLSPLEAMACVASDNDTVVPVDSVVPYTDFPSEEWFNRSARAFTRLQKLYFLEHVRITGLVPNLLELSRVTPLPYEEIRPEPPFYGGLGDVYSGIYAYNDFFVRGVWRFGPASSLESRDGNGEYLSPHEWYLFPGGIPKPLYIACGSLFPRLCEDVPRIFLERGGSFSPASLSNLIPYGRKCMLAFVDGCRAFKPKGPRGRDSFYDLDPDWKAKLSGDEWPKCAPDRVIQRKATLNGKEINYAFKERAIPPPPSLRGPVGLGVLAPTDPIVPVVVTSSGEGGESATKVLVGGTPAEIFIANIADSPQVKDAIAGLFKQQAVWCVNEIARAIGVPKNIINRFFSVNEEQYVRENPGVSPPRYYKRGK